MFHDHPHTQSQEVSPLLEVLFRSRSVPKELNVPKIECKGGNERSDLLELLLLSIHSWRYSACEECVFSSTFKVVSAPAASSSRTEWRCPCERVKSDGIGGGCESIHLLHFCSLLHWYYRLKLHLTVANDKKRLKSGRLVASVWVTAVCLTEDLETVARR